MKNVNVLIVEDEVDLLNSLSNGLSVEYSNIFKAKNGKEALNILSENEIHIVVTDLNMPIMDGNELIKNIFKERLNIPIIVLSAYSEVLEEYKHMKSIKCLRKPYDIRELMQRIQESLSLKSVLECNPYDKAIEICNKASELLKKINSM